jgi:hypothetical protein
MRPKNFFFLFIFISFLISITMSYAQTGHWELSHPKTNPGARMGHDMATIGYHKVLLFAGETYYDGDLNDTWIYDLDKNEWDSIKCKNSPTAREAFSMCQINEKQILLFGGTRISYHHAFSDLWLFDLDSMDWREIKFKQPKDTNYLVLSRYSHRIIKLNNNQILIIGGQEETSLGFRYPLESCIYSIDSNIWECHPDQMGLRDDFMITELSDSLAFLFGGEIWWLSCLSDNWLIKQISTTEVKFDSLTNLNNQDNCIYNSDMKHIRNGIVLLFGGFSKDDSTAWIHTDSDNTMICDINKSRWIMLNLDLKPKGRFLHKMAVIDSNKVLLFGGYNINYKLVDTWLFILDSVSTSVIEPIFEQNYLNLHQISDNDLEILYNSNNELNSIITIYDIRGNLQYSSTLSNQIIGINRQLVDISRLSTGVYYIIIQNGVNFLREKFIVYR